eukprot:TRINITY_DN115680_c0_g1_i1.p1 TRINITY_DN115680_c0_g1~~TRINITY_DN115680_c0_g1_i1.p1  ORF type:complete len:221 (-),score=10.72 TRINITY_DN115680_c0_g1_i1:143-805(-)
MSADFAHWVLCMESTSTANLPEIPPELVEIVHEFFIPYFHTWSDHPSPGLTLSTDRKTVTAHTSNADWCSILCEDTIFPCSKHTFSVCITAAGAQTVLRDYMSHFGFVKEAAFFYDTSDFRTMAVNSLGNARFTVDMRTQRRTKLDRYLEVGDVVTLTIDTRVKGAGVVRLHVNGDARGVICDERVDSALWLAPPLKFYAAFTTPNISVTLVDDPPCVYT